MRLFCLIVVKVKVHNPKYGEKKGSDEDQWNEIRMEQMRMEQMRLEPIVKAYIIDVSTPTGKIFFEWVLSFNPFNKSEFNSKSPLQNVLSPFQCSAARISVIP